MTGIEQKLTNAILLLRELGGTGNRQKFTDAADDLEHCLIQVEDVLNALFPEPIQLPDDPFLVSHDAYYNLMGALVDAGSYKDTIVSNTIARVLSQLGSARETLISGEEEDNDWY